MLCSLSFSQTVPRQANPYGWSWGCRTALWQNSFSVSMYTAGVSESTLDPGGSYANDILAPSTFHLGTTAAYILAIFNSSQHLFPFQFASEDNSALTRSSGKGACCQDWPLDFKSWELHGGRETTPESCPLAYTHTPQKLSLKSITNIKKSLL